MAKKKTVEDYLASVPHWQPEVTRLVELLRTCDLDEHVKWGMPCYTANGRNVVAVAAFKPYFGLWFYDGATLDDKDGVLVNAQEGKTKALRQWRMTKAVDIKAASIRRYIKAAIAVAHQEKAPPAAKSVSVRLPGELEALFAKDKALAKKFSALTSGRQRDFADYVATAKRDETRRKRLEKIRPMIKAGEGLHDRYRSG